jgi:two-component system cell cycle sensor histidine kinase/response regulator CckA
MASLSGESLTVATLPDPLEVHVRSDHHVRGAWVSPAPAGWAGAIVVCVALAVLLAWALDMPTLERALPGLVAMNPLTAACLLFAAFSLVLVTAEPLPSSAPLLSRLCAGAVIMAAFVAASRFYTHWDSGLDLVLFRDKLLSGAGGPIRMAPASAFNFVLTGLALMVLDVRTRRGHRPAVSLAAVMGLSALLVLMGFLYQSRGLFGIWRFISTALTTAACFFTLSLGIIAAHPGSGFHRLLTRSTPGALLARRLLPAAIALPIALGWLVFEGQSRGLFDVGSGAALLATVVMLIMTGLIWRSTVWLDKTEEARTRAEKMLHDLNEDLEGRVAERTGELARMNEALLDQTRFLHQVLDTSPQLVFVKDWAGRYTLANQATADLYGTTVEGLIGKTDAHFTSGTEQAAAVEGDREVMLKRQAKVIAEEPATDERTGTVRWFHTIKAPLVGRDGGCNRILGLRTDITARHYAEGELRRASDELRALFDASPLAICGLTGDGYVRSWNLAAEELFGWTAGEVVGRMLPNVPRELRDECRGLRDSVLSGRPVTNFETHRSRKDGELIAVSVSTAPLHDASGRIHGIVVVYGDIRNRKELEAQLRQSQKMEAIGQLAGGVAHDFNNLLTVIRTASELLLGDLSPGDRRRTEVEDIEEAALRAASLTHQLLAFSRQQVLEPQVVDLNRVVTELEPMARRLVQENIAVELRLAGDLHRVTADRHQLDQVILNLVLNACDAMPVGGTVLIETSNVILDEEFRRTHPGARSGPHILLSVSDTGCGMDAATQARIFEPFFTTKPVGVGTGLGLATVYGIVKQSGGHIWATSEVGRGSSFKIYLPVSGTPEHEPPPAVGNGHRSQAGAGTEARILVVEDDTAVRGAVCRVLKRCGYDVVDFQSGEQAIATLADAPQSVDLVISDIVMPEMSGLELRERLREIQPPVPVLLMTGYSQEVITRLSNRESLGPLIEKPFTVDGLLEHVRSVLDG